jgi:hypothetical protein
MKALKSTLISLFILILSSNSFAGQSQLGKYPIVYEGDDYVVTILKIGNIESNTTLIKVNGIDNKFDGEIYLHIKKCDNTDCSNYKYETKEVPGKENWWTVQSTRSWGEYDNVILYPPGINKKISITKVKRPKDFDSDKFYSEYLGQKARR